VDAALVASASADTIALSNGCVCCSIGDDLTGALFRVLEASPPFDAIVVEASGVSDPWRIAQVGLADPGLSLGGVIVLVDAAAAGAQARDPLLADSLQRQLRAADLVVINKTDLATAQELERVRAWVTEAVGATPQFETTHAALSGELLWGVAPERLVRHDARCSDHDEHGHGHGHEHAEMFEAWTHHPPEALGAAALRAALRAMPPGVLRLKGLVRTDEHGWAELQFAGKHGSLRRLDEAPAGSAVVVAIGLRGRLPQAALAAIFDAAARAAQAQSGAGA
jgi:G3E family GTPase